MADPCRILSSERPSADPHPIELRGSRPSRARRLRPAPRPEGGLTYRPGLGRAKLPRTESASHEIGKNTRIMLATAIVLCCQFRHRSILSIPSYPY